MNPRVLFVVTSDPRCSPRPAEAVRIAAGVGVWKKVDVAVYLRGEAILALGESAEGLVDEDNFSQYWPVLAEAAQSVYVQKSADCLRHVAPARVKFTEISDDELARLTIDQTCVIRF